jgi:hypothetical protein
LPTIQEHILQPAFKPAVLAGVQVALDHPNALVEASCSSNAVAPRNHQDFRGICSRTPLALYDAQKFSPMKQAELRKTRPMIKFKTSVSAIAVAMFLVACGGGSNSGSTGQIATVPPVSTPGPAFIPGDLQTSVPALTYAATSAEHEFLTALNQFRDQVGLGLLAQNDLLDKAARNHLEYVLR